jgi:dephospho-CoA kinase
LLIIGLTGGIACGKSAVSGVLKKFGAKTLDIDTVTHELLEPNGTLFEVYVQHFGKYIVAADGTLNKKIIGEIIFNHPEERQWINSVAHPILLNAARDFLEDCAAEGVEIALVEVPLLFEAGWEHLFDEIWAVNVGRSKQIWRLVQRDKLTQQQAVARVNSQMPPEEICRRADVVINNKKSIGHTKKQVLAALKGRLIRGHSFA